MGVNKRPERPDVNLRRRLLHPRMQPLGVRRCRLLCVLVQRTPLDGLAELPQCGPTHALGRLGEQIEAPLLVEKPYYTAIRTPSVRFRAALAGPRRLA